ncbi:MAG TPA: transferrin receptor-like dimerization domain-containing protein [Thermoanaerobaculia bacterium]|jgi:N-acetylated-alpha-linked acidic dipeptidase|nr:transferrin receptor-like dimerization domain-containing protein [Thermoanaerobaculia bacterium]
MAAIVGAAGPADAPPMLGFSGDRAAAERALEAKLDAAIDPAQIGEWIKVLSARPHHLGSPYDKENAERIAGWFREWGYDTSIEEFQVLFPTPKERRLELVAPTHFQASLAEDTIAEDSTSGQHAEQLPTYNAYSIDGDVTGELVYVNYGVPADYEELAKRGVDVKGKIAIARYGGSWRGIKPKVAAEHGAIGCIIYSDPSGDGYYEGDMYPKGGWRPPQGVQRGSVADMPLHPGDPLTPGVGAVAGAKRLARSEAQTLTKITVLPISARDAQPLLAAMSGPMAPEEWRGALPLPYHLGPGPAKVHLKLVFDWQVRPIYDVIAKLPGRELPDEWVMRGNHHDAWVNGATDPVSGLAALLAEAKAVAGLARDGWRPSRTIVYAAWDGEEPGLLGSTEFAEQHAQELQKKLVVYMNSDTNSRGFLDIGGSHALEPFVNQVMADVRDPQIPKSVADRERAHVTLTGEPELRDVAKTGGDLRIEPLGSGSDYTPFLQHLGVATLNLGFSDEEQYGQYHSIYDSYDHYRRFGDPGFIYGKALAEVGGRLTLRLAEADLLPFDLQRLADTIGRYADEVQKLTAKMRDDTAEENRRIREGVYAAGWDPKETWVVPEPKEPVPYLNFAPLANAVERLKEAAGRHSKAVAARRAQGPMEPAAAAPYDQGLMAIEHSLTRSQGLPGRPWFVHQIYAPGKYTGYGVKTLPAVREAIEQRKWDEAEQQIGVLAEVLRGATAAIDRATAALESR